MPEEVPGMATTPALMFHVESLVSPVSAEVGQRCKTASPTRVAVRVLRVAAGFVRNASRREVGLGAS